MHMRLIRVSDRENSRRAEDLSQSCEAALVQLYSCTAVGSYWSYHTVGSTRIPVQLGPHCRILRVPVPVLLLSFKSRLVRIHALRAPPYARRISVAESRVHRNDISVAESRAKSQDLSAQPRLNLQLYRYSWDHGRILRVPVPVLLLYLYVTGTGTTTTVPMLRVHSTCMKFCMYRYYENRVRWHEFLPVLASATSILYRYW